MSLGSNSFGKLGEIITRLHADKIINQLHHGLIYLLLAQKFLREPDEIQECIVDGSNDCGIDAIYIDRKPELPVVNIIQSKFHTSESASQNAFEYSALYKIERFFEILKNKDLDLTKVANPALQQKILEIRDLQNRDFPEFKVWLVSNGKPCVEHEIQPMALKLKSQEIHLEQFHLTDFIEFCVNSHSSRNHHTFLVREAGVVETGNTELYSVVGYISASELYHVLKDLHNERKMDYSLFNMNVRSFLGMSSPINKDIFKSASSPHNIHFSSLNNGITIVGSDVKVVRTAQPYKIGVKKMSIVNGAQTCSAIFDSMKDHYPDFSRFENLSVLFRLFKTDDPETIEKIAVSTNSQNRIQPRDLKANDNFQLKLEKELADHGIAYLRKRGNFETIADNGKKLDALKAGQLILAYVHHDPATAKRQSDSIFEERYNKIFADVKVEKLVRALNLYEKIEEYQQAISDEVRIRGILRTENTFVTYGGFHVLTLCSKIEELSPEKSDEDLINQALSIITECLHEAGQPAYYTFFRDASATSKMFEKCYQLNLFDDHKKTGT